jgi:hypothetical protein
MIACVYCGRDVEYHSLSGGVVTSTDSDLACSEICAERYKSNWDPFISDAIPVFSDWQGGSLSFL